MKDGGPAFACGGPHSDQGMSLRDWFAGQALAGMLASTMSVNDGHEPTYLPWSEAASAARQAYEVADAMLVEREKKS